MAYSKRIALLMGLAATAAIGSALPVQASVDGVETIDAALSADAVDVDLSDVFLGQAVETPEQAISPEAATEPVANTATEASVITVEQVLQENSQVSTSATQLLAPEAGLLNAASLESFDAAGIETALAAADVDAAQENLDENVELAQLTRGSYGGVSPIYVGVAGNIGFGDQDRTGIADFGFNVISKISLGPAFSVRPGVTISDRTSFTIPLTYNFDLLDLGGFRFQPYVGAGADISDGVGLLLNAGADLPISRDFTLNAATNWRVTSGFGVGISLGVGYNFPFIFD